MENTRKLLTIAFAIFLFIGSAAISASAQQRKHKPRIIYRPVIVQPYYGHNWYWNRWYNPYYHDFYYYNPYVEIQRQRYYLRRELEGNERELQKHLEKYSADGVLTAKEREELEDDYRDVEKAKRKLALFDRRYGR